jgi:hypothetical protein
LASATQTVNENAGSFSITVKLTGATNAAATIPFSIGGTAVAGTNYTVATPSPLVIPAGQTSAVITGNLLDDNRFDVSDTTLVLTLGTPTNSVLGGVTADTVTIHETDPAPSVAFATAAQTVNENAGTFTATVKLSAASNVPTTIPFTLAGTAASGVNYNGVTASPLVIPAGQTTGTIGGTLLDDGKFDGTRRWS